MTKILYNGIDIEEHVREVISAFPGIISVRLKEWKVISGETYVSFVGFFNNKYILSPDHWVRIDEEIIQKFPDLNIEISLQPPEWALGRQIFDEFQRAFTNRKRQ